MTPPRSIVFTGGGSAGHVVPCLPVMDAFAASGWAVSFVGGTDGPERQLIGATRYPFKAISAGKLRRYFSLRNATDVVRVVAGVWQSYRWLRATRPAIVFSKGGFVAFPVVVGAWLNRIPVVAHESDLTPGLANRLSLPFCRAVCTNFSDTRFARGPDTRFARRALEVVHTGTPVRETLLRGDAPRGRARVGAPASSRLLLVVGGSLGSENLNALVRAALPSFATWFVVHVCGSGRVDAALASTPGYRQLEYVGDGWGDVLAAADVVVSRAGANSLYELVALAKPHVLVPLTRAASRGDQLENARYAAARGWSRVVAEDAGVRALVAAVEEVWREREAVRARLAAAGLADGTAAIRAVLERFAR